MWNFAGGLTFPVVREKTSAPPGVAAPEAEGRDRGYGLVALDTNQRYMTHERRQALVVINRGFGTSGPVLDRTPGYAASGRGAA